jgi:effector-binding domain-containing protein
VRTYDIVTSELVEQPTAVVRGVVPVSEMGTWLRDAYGAVAGYLSAHGAGPAGMPFARFHQLGGHRFEVEAGFPAYHEVAGAGPVVASRLPGGLAAQTWHMGPYEAVAEAYEAMQAWIADHGGEPIGDPWEVYYSDPTTEPDPSAWRTEVVQPYRAG